MHRLIIFILVYATMITTLNAQSVWKTLANVKYKTRYDEVLKYEVDYPEFASEIKAIEGKTIEAKGYMVPLDEYLGTKFFILSALPYNVCFFCGAAGPETVMEIYTKEEIEFTEKPVRVRGKLELNDRDYDHLMYILRDAEFIDE